MSAIELSASIASLAWAVAKIGALVLGFPFLQFATTICLFASVGLATSAIIYKIHLTEKGKKEVHEKGKLSALA